MTGSRGLAISLRTQPRERARARQVRRRIGPNGDMSEGRRRQVSTVCTHIDQIREVTPSAQGCEDCLKIGSWWVHLRECQICGHVGCCDSSPNKHATKQDRKSVV